MKVLHFDCYAGISGDMALGALVDLGLDPEELRGELEKLGLEGWKLDFVRENRNGISGIHAVVDLGGSLDHLAGHKAEDQSHGHHHNTWREIRAVIENSRIREGAKKRALDIFSRIARAEAQVHDLPPEEVAFHEVGAMDSIIDIVGTAIGLDILNPRHITAGEIELGSGVVKCAHGILPVPAPATLVLVKGLPVRTGGFNKEMTTPTGAAILASSVDEFITAPASFKEINTGIGIGSRKMERANVLRVSWREMEDARAESSRDQPWDRESLVLMEANIDDMTGEAMGFLMEKLFETGALDVSFSPLTMKKSRPGTLVSVLGRPENLDLLRESFFRHSTTIGFKESPVNRVFLKRGEKSLDLEGLGKIRTKTAFLGEEKLRTKIEFEDRARTAREKGLSLDRVEELIRDRDKSE